MRNGNVPRSRDFWAESPNMFQSRSRGSHDIRLTRSQQGAVGPSLDDGIAFQRREQGSRAGKLRSQINTKNTSCKHQSLQLPSSVVCLSNDMECDKHSEDKCLLVGRSLKVLQKHHALRSETARKISKGIIVPDHDIPFQPSIVICHTQFADLPDFETAVTE